MADEVDPPNVAAGGPTPLEGGFIQDGNAPDQEQLGVVATGDETTSDNLATPERLATSDRRRARRWAPAQVPWVSLVQLATGESAELINISSGGALIRLATRLSPGSRSTLIVLTSEQRIGAGGRVVRCHVDSIARDGTVVYQMAMRFDSELELDLNTQDRLISGAPSEQGEARFTTSEESAQPQVTREWEPAVGVSGADSSAVASQNDW